MTRRYATDGASSATTLTGRRPPPAGSPRARAGRLRGRLHVFGSHGGDGGVSRSEGYHGASPQRQGPRSGEDRVTLLRGHGQREEVPVAHEVRDEHGLRSVVDL